MPYNHQQLAAGRWHELSLCEQMGNIGSEISRALCWRDRDERNFNSAVDRALELFDLTLADPRWVGRLREIARAREVFLDAVFGGKEYKGTLGDIDKYFFRFAYCARLAIP